MHTDDTTTHPPDESHTVDNTTSDITTDALASGSEVLDHEQSTSPHNVPCKRAKRISVEDKLIAFLDSYQQPRRDPADDADSAFFTSLLPAIRRLTLDQTMTFRIQVMQLLVDIQACGERDSDPQRRPMRPADYCERCHHIPPQHFFRRQRQYPRTLSAQHCGHYIVVEATLRCLVVLLTILSRRRILM
jgi:hypothetical protein